MSRFPAVALVGAVAAAAVGVRLARPPRPRPAWHSVTVLAAPADIDVYARLGALRHLQLRVEPAPGDRGTELHARYDRPVTPARTMALRAALRETKSVAETGRVVVAVPRPHGRRRRTPWGLAQDAFERRARGIGLG